MADTGLLLRRGLGGSGRAASCILRCWPLTEAPSGRSPLGWPPAWSPEAGRLAAGRAPTGSGWRGRAAATSGRGQKQGPETRLRWPRGSPLPQTGLAGASEEIGVWRGPRGGLGVQRRASRSLLPPHTQARHLLVQMPTVRPGRAPAGRWPGRLGHTGVRHELQPSQPEGF